MQAQISFLFSTISKIFSLKIFQNKNYFINKFKQLLHELKILQSDYAFNSSNNNFIYIDNKNIKKNTKSGKFKIKSKAIKIMIKYYQKKLYKNNYLHSLNYSFIYWCSLISKFPSFIYRNKKLSKSFLKEEYLEKKGEIKELQNNIKEDKDFQHDLKAKISALDEENNFLNEKIFDITQRVEKCEKCNNLLKSTSFISENKIRTSLESIMKNAQEEENIIKKSRNALPDKKDTTSSGINIVTVGTDLIPKKPRDYLENDDLSEEDSMQIDEESDKKKKNEISENDFISEAQNYKQKIIDLKKEKEPIIEKLKEEINKLYQELNMD